MESGAPAVVVDQVVRLFGQREAVSGLTFTVPTGSVFGFLGPNGAGKTTTVRLMVGMLRPSAGTIRVWGLDPVRDGDRVRALSGVMLDQVGLYERLTAQQNLELAARVGRLSGRESRERVKAMLHRVELWDRRLDRVSAFSKGMRQKLGLGRALLMNPKLLVLDEPTAGLDPANIVMVRDLLTSLAQEGGRTIFVCTHLLAEAQRICDQVAIIRGGRLLAVGAPQEIGGQAAPSVRLVLSGLDAGQVGGLGLPEGVGLTFLGRNEWRVAVPGAEAVEGVVAALVNAGIGVRAVIPEQESLEEVYLRVIGGEHDA